MEALRKFARERIRNNPKMTVAQREELGIFPPDTHPTPAPVPERGPEVVMEIDAALVGWVFARYLGGKPSGVAWVEVAWEVSDTVITRAEALTHREAIPHNPWKCNFSADEQGRTLYLAMRYATHGGASPWSAVHSVTIP
ncbi:MAG: hypothetical protein LBP86_05200 [Azoarcus sp.]|nr:hypothetical protein [Azoarcus sp.]